MAIIEYDNNEKVFIRKEFNKSSGDKNSYTQAFYSNKWIENEIEKCPFFTFNTPLYTTIGGTTNYYGQDLHSIFTNISRPFISFNFSANTDSFGTGTTILHNLYRIDYKTYLNHLSKLKNDEATKENISTTETIEETTTNESGNKTTIKKERKTTTTEKKEKFYTKNFHEGREVYLTGQTEDNHNEIRELLRNPVLTLSASTTGITTNIYNLFIDEYYKNLGSKKFQVFQDKAQYFLTTNFKFYRTQGEEFVDFYKYDNENGLYQYDFQKEFIEQTPIRSSVITGGTFSGVSVTGNFFTYFLIPNKPKLEEPYVQGQLNTFTPTFYFKDVDDGDKYLLQIVYNEKDSQSFSGTVYSYPLSKEDSNLDVEEMLGLESGDWGKAVERTDVVRKFSVPLKYGSQFWYRIGNVKYIENIFGVEQSVVTFSDIGSATTASDNISNFVRVESDSPHIESITGWLTPDYLDESNNTYSLSGIVSGSVITGATMQLTYPNGNYITKTTDLTGYYEFDELQNGIYTLTTSYRGYQQDERSVTISGDTGLSFKIKLVWGNNYDTWGGMANENYFL